MLWAKFPKAKGNQPFGELLRRPVQWLSFSSGNGGDMRKTLLGLVALAVWGSGVWPKPDWALGEVLP
jgi:hypothetical protein